MGLTFDSATYAESYETYRLAAEAVRVAVYDALSGSTHNIQEIQARAKHPDSANEKLTRNGESAKEITDLIGVRVVVLYDDAVQAIVDRLRAWFEEESDLFRDKSEQLQEKEVGYRGVHIFLKGLSVTASDPKVRDLARSTVVEVQVKSLAAHTWAEAEHTLRYKAGSGVPGHIRRRFNSLAGALELVDRELVQIHLAIVKHVADLADAYARGDRLEEEDLSSLQLLGVLRYFRPDMPSQGSHGLKMDIEDAFRIAKILCDQGIRTPGSLVQKLGSPATTQAVNRYISLTGLPLKDDQAAALVVLGVIIGLEDPAAILSVQDMREDPNLQRALLPMSDSG